MQLANKALQILLVTFGNYLYGSVCAVPHPSDQSQLLSISDNEKPESYSLYLAGYDCM